MCQANVESPEARFGSLAASVTAVISRGDGIEDTFGCFTTTSIAAQGRSR